MEKILISAFLLFFVSPVFGQTQVKESVPSFTDHDLKKYGTSSLGSSSSGSSSQSRESGQSDKPGNNASRSDKVTASGLKRIEIPYIGYVGTARRIIVNVKLNDSVTVPMAVDTGAPGMVISTAVAEKLNILTKDEGKLITQSSGIGGSTPSIFTIIESVQVGDLRDEFIPTQIIDKEFPGFQGLIGMDFMANYKVNIDTEKGVLVFEEQPSGYKRPGGHDEAWWRTNFRQFAAMKNSLQALREKLSKQQTDMPYEKKIKDFVESQYLEAEKLFNRLDSYAIRHSVPMHWRSY